MSDLNKCFRCGVFDIDDGVPVCRMNGHRIENSFTESCEQIIQVDEHIDMQNEQIGKLSKENELNREINRNLANANADYKQELEKLKVNRSRLKCCECGNEPIDMTGLGLLDEVEKLTKLFEAYCVCNSMGATGGPCCFCEDLEKAKNSGKAIKGCGVCGEPIYADTEEWKVPVCYTHSISTNEGSEK